MTKGKKIHNVDDGQKSTLSYYQLNTFYEITINPIDAYQHFTIENVNERLRSCYNSLVCMLSGRIDITLNIEISEKNMGHTSKTGKTMVYHGRNRVHGHGLIKFHTKDQLLYFLLTKFSKLSKMSSIAINPYRPEYWDAYINKQQWLIPDKYKTVTNKSKHILLEDEEEFDKGIGKFLSVTPTE